MAPDPKIVICNLWKILEKGAGILPSSKTTQDAAYTLNQTS